MSATKNYLQDYNAAVDKAWQAIEQAIVSMNAVNDLIYAEDGEIRCHCPRGDVALLKARVQKLTGEVNTMMNAQEPHRLPPILPGEIRLPLASARQ